MNSTLVTAHLFFNTEVFILNTEITDETGINASTSDAAVDAYHNITTDFEPLASDVKEEKPSDDAKSSEEEKPPAAQTSSPRHSGSP